MGTNEYIQKTSEYLAKVFDVSVETIMMVLPQAIGFAVALFLLSLVVLKFLAKRGIFTRSNRIWNMLSKLHYPAWITIFVLAGFTIGAINATISEIGKTLDETFKPYVESNLPALKDFLVEQLPEFDPDETITVREATQRLLQALYYKPKNDGLMESVKARSVNWVTLNLGKWIITYSVAAMAKTASEFSAHHLHMSDETIEFTKNTIKKMDLSQVNKNIAQIVYEAVDGQVRAALRGLQMQYSIFFAALLGILCIEPGVYFFWWKKKHEVLSNKSL